jgi:hypothetical protein
MKSLHILLVTRNRLLGIIDALSSIKRIAPLLKVHRLNLEISIQDNSDYNIPDFILKYFRKYLRINYYKTSDVLPMSINWNEGLKNAFKMKPDYISILADRRLASANLFNAVWHLENQREPFLCFDHQDVWINSQSIIARGHGYNLQIMTRDHLLSAIGSARIDWHFPMLFNCLVTYDFMMELNDRYGSFCEGVSPDMNFLARIADMGIDRYFIYDAPCILTNARHAVLSGGSSSHKSGTVYEHEHTQLSGIESFPEYMENFVTANILGSLARYWSAPKMRRLINPHGFFRSSLLELSFPKSGAAFVAMRESLERFLDDFGLDVSEKILLNNVIHAKASSQTFPIDYRSGLVNTPNLDLLDQIEDPLILGN